MQQKIIFYTGIYRPADEGVSKEIAVLQREFGGTVYGINSDEFLRISEKYISHYARPYRAAMWLARASESMREIGHIYHNFNNLYFVGNLKQAPLILTGAAGGKLLPLSAYRNINLIVAESERDKNRLLEHGLEADRVRLIYPGIRFNPVPLPAADRFTVLFASSPFAPEYFTPRGVDLLVEAACNLPEIRFILLWRNFAGTVSKIKKMIDGVPNIELQLGKKDASEFFVQAHTVICPYTDFSLAKPCPNSILDSFSFGRPVLASTKVQIADLIKTAGAGVIFEPELSSLLEAISELKKNYSRYSENVQSISQDTFSEENFINCYRELYAQLGSAQNLP